jgi:hypothetical protein
VAAVVIGVDPHKLSATPEVLDERERALGGGRFTTDRDGYRQMLVAGRRWPDRVWAVEGCNGMGRHVTQRLVADGETVVDVPAKLSARTRVFSTGHGRKTDATDAHSIAAVAVRTPGLSPATVDDELVALRLLADRRDELAGARSRTVSKPRHRLDPARRTRRPNLGTGLHEPGRSPHRRPGPVAIGTVSQPAFYEQTGVTTVRGTSAEWGSGWAGPRSVRDRYSPPPVVVLVGGWLTTEIDIEETRDAFDGDDHDQGAQPQSDADGREHRRVQVGSPPLRGSSASRARLSASGDPTAQPGANKQPQDRRNHSNRG